MNTEEEIIVEPSFKKEIQVSLVFHVIILSVFSLKSVFFSSDDIDYKSAVRVDIVDLPDKVVKAAKVVPPTKEAPKPIEKKIPPVEKPKPKPADNTINLKSKQESAIERMRALEKLKDEQELEKSQEAALSKIKEFKGNILSKGAAIDGIIANQHTAYVGELDVYIKQHWSLPRWLSEEALTSSVLVKLDARGYVIYRQLSRSSGNGGYDDIAIKTIDIASPFPAPPENLASSLREKGFTIEFNNQEK